MKQCDVHQHFTTCYGGKNPVINSVQLVTVWLEKHCYQLCTACYGGKHCYQLCTDCYIGKTLLSTLYSLLQCGSKNTVINSLMVGMAKTQLYKLFIAYYSGKILLLTHYSLVWLKTLV